jgi:hypothetical protein
MQTADGTESGATQPCNCFALPEFDDRRGLAAAARMRGACCGYELYDQDSDRTIV